MLLLTFAEKSSVCDVAGTDQFCRTDCCTLYVIPDQRRKFRTIFLKQVEFGLQEPEAIWIRKIPARHTFYTLDRVAPSSKLVRGSSSKGLWEPEGRLFVKLPVESGWDPATLTFTHPNKSEFTVMLQQTYPKFVNIRIDPTDKPETATSLSGYHFRIRAPEWIKVGAHVECVLGCRVYVLDLDVDM